METDRLIHRQNTASSVFKTCMSSNTWKYILVVLAVVFIFLVQFALIPSRGNPNENLSLTRSGSNNADSNGKENIFIFEGKNEDPENYTGFPGFDTKLTRDITEIQIKKAALDAPAFSKALQEFIELEVLYLDNVTLVGEFSRVYLPHLKSFTLNQVNLSQSTEQYPGSENLLKNLFFDKIEMQPWKVKDICNLGVDLFVTLNGFTLIQINRERGEIGLYGPDSNDILQGTNWKFTRLSLSTCTVSESSIPSNIEYLNMFDVPINDGNLNQILGRLSGLTDFYYDSPGAVVDLAVLPPTLTLLSLSSATVTCSNPTTLSNLSQFSLGFCNISAEVYNKFNLTFPVLERIAAFGRQSANYELLERSFKLKKVAWILMEEFERVTTNTRDTELETKLINLNISSNASNFLIKKPKYSNEWVGFVLTNTQDEEREYRYTLLGWGDFLTFPAYKTADKYAIKA